MQDKEGKLKTLQIQCGTKHLSAEGLETLDQRGVRLLRAL